MRQTPRHLTRWTAAWMLGGLMLAGVSQAQGVYKWVDDQGHTHYGAQPPAEANSSEPVKIHNPSRFGGNNSRPPRPGVEYHADGTKKIPQGVQELGDGLIKGLQKVSPKTVPLDCNRAVANIQDQADAMLAVGEKNVKDGYLRQSEYDTVAARIRQARAEASVSECLLASGNKQGFYQCMSNDRNHVTGCAKKYP
jgi:hypothetical protein